MSLRVLTLTPFFPSAQNEAYGCFIAEPLQALRQCGVNADVIAVSPAHKRKPQNISSAGPVEWLRYPAVPGNSGLSSAGVFLFARILSRVRKLHSVTPIDLIHAHAALPCGHAAVLLSRELGIPYVVTVHGLDAFFTNQSKGWLGTLCHRAAKYVYHAARRVICISERVQEAVLTGAPRAQCAVIYNGVNTDIFFPSAVGADPATILSVGNLIPTKGHELLLRSVASLRMVHAGLRCEIIGEGPELERLKKLAEQLGISNAVNFLGRCNRSRVADEMRRCTLFALPSHYEGLGCVYLEAMACGKPVIGCRGQGIEEIVQHGRNGLLMNPENGEELTAAISLLLQRPRMREELGVAAHETISFSLTIHQQAEELLRIYQESLV